MKKKKRIDRSSIRISWGNEWKRDRCMGMYRPILNCRYRNDKIVFDWTEYEPPIEDERI